VSIELGAHLLLLLLLLLTTTTTGTDSSYSVDYLNIEVMRRWKDSELRDVAALLGRRYSEIIGRRISTTGNSGFEKWHKICSRCTTGQSAPLLGLEAATPRSERTHRHWEL